MVCGLALELLGREVAGCAKKLAGPRRAGERDSLRGRGVRRGVRLALVTQPGQAEIEDLDLSIGRDEQVLGLQVAVDDDPRVCGSEPARRLRDQLERLPDAEVTLPQPLTQRLALEQLGDDVGMALRHAEVVHRQDVGVLERRQRPRLCLEATQTSGLPRGLVGKNLDRHFSAEAAVAGAVDLSHAAGADRRQDLVGSQPGSGLQWHDALAIRRSAPLTMTESLCGRGESNPHALTGTRS